MQRSTVGAVVVLAVLLAGLLALPTSGAPVASGSVHLSLSPAPARAVPLVAPHPTLPARAHPAAGFPRTVLVETFSGEWCGPCVAESQAMYLVEHELNRSVVDIGELHVCWVSSECALDSYPPVDGTSYSRFSYYHLQGTPAVLFDGGQLVYGIYPPYTAAGMEPIYRNAILNASAIPGNVSIAQTATLASGGQVSVHANITSDITGTYRAFTYLLQDQGYNDSSHHDIGYVVRAMLLNQSVSLTTGGSTAVSGLLTLGAGWTIANLSVVTFVQDVGTAVIENTNMIPVTTLAASMTPAASRIASGHATNLTIQVTNTSTGLAVPGATVSLSGPAGSLFTPATGTTGADGSFQATFTAPPETSDVQVQVSAQVTAPGQTANTATALVDVYPLVLPDAPTGLSLAPAGSEASLAWSAPASGAGGIVYHVYRSADPMGPFTALGTTTATNYTDSTVQAGQVYYYQVAAQDSAGYSPNTTALAAVSIETSTHGIPASVGWWLTIDSVTLTQATDSGVTLYLAPSATGYGYSFGVDSYAYLAPNDFGTLTVGSSPVTFTVAFTPNYATFQGTVSPADATITFNGTALPVTGGAFLDVVNATSYRVQVAASGYQTNSTVVLLTPGNTTTLNFVLQANAASGNSGLLGGMGATSIGLLGIAAAVIVVAAVAAVMLVRRRRSPPTGA